MKLKSWIISPPSIPVQSRFKAPSSGYFCYGVPRGKVSFVSLLNFSCPSPLPGEASLPPLPASFAGLPGNLGLSTREGRGPNHARPAEHWSTRSGNTLIGVEPHFSISRVCHGTTFIFMLRISSSPVPVQRPKVGRREKSILRSFQATCDHRMLERSLYPQNILCVSFLWLLTQIATHLAA